MTNSKQLLQLIQQHLIPEMYIFPERFYYIDAIWRKRDMAIEVKCKDDFYTQPIIEKHKWDGMLIHKNKRYINLMRKPDGTELVYSFNINKIEEPKWEWIMQPNASNELYTGWVPKLMGKLDISYAKDITNLLFKK